MRLINQSMPLVTRPHHRSADSILVAAIFCGFCRMTSWLSSNESCLLALPDPYLLAVLQFCAADDQCSLFSAARAHNRLHQAAVLALSSITPVVTKQQQADGVLRYLGQHSQHVHNIALGHDDDSYCRGCASSNGKVILRELPCNQLTSLHLHSVRVQLQPGKGCSRCKHRGSGFSRSKGRSFEGVLPS